MSTNNSPVIILTRRMIGWSADVVIDYPEIVGMPNTGVQQWINNAVFLEVRKLMAQQMNQLINIQGYPQNVKVTMNSWFEVKTNERGILSLSLGNYTIATPAAHGFTIIKSLTFSLETGRIYRLQDLFKPGSDYVQVLSEIVSVQIKEREISLINDFTTIKPDQDYYIADKALVLYFQLYEITAYVYGFPEFPISVFEIQDIIKEDGPLGILAANY